MDSALSYSEGVFFLIEVVDRPTYSQFVVQRFEKKQEQISTEAAHIFLPSLSSIVMLVGSFRQARDREHH